MTQTSPFDQNLFEAASALGTVGLSMGITSSLNVIGKLIIIALVQQRPPEPPGAAPEELVI